MPFDLLRQPDAVFVFHDDSPQPVYGNRVDDRWTTPAVEIATTLNKTAMSIDVHCKHEPIARIALRWRGGVKDDSLILGDAWERGYGDLQWRHVQSERVMPWYFAIHQQRTSQTFAAGVRTQPNAMCAWTIDDHGITLWLDLHNGGLPSVPGDRVIHAAEIVQQHGDDPLDTLRELCNEMCPTPRLTPQPVCGNNNWYYAYGKNFDHRQVLRDATLLAELAGGHANAPHCVIDAGWSPGSACPGGPWIAGRPDTFPDMPGLAKEITALGVKPGIWMRPTALTTVDNSKRLRAGPQNSAEKALDLTLEDNHAIIAEEVRRLVGWGYQLIKHDFSTWDAFARWGLDMGAKLTDGDWHWADRTFTNAEIILRHYRNLRDAAGDAVLIGCNTFGHLAAGLFELQRTGDDTSGRHWERTRKMGVNTLAFRLPQHGTFFAADADCVAHTPATPWEKDKQWLDLVARSGTALFVSIDPLKITQDQKAAMSAAMRLALSGGQPNPRPIDWLYNTCPARWEFDGEPVQYDWPADYGAWPLPCL